MSDLLVPRAAQERYLDTAIGVLRVLHAGPDAGSGTPLMLVHGGGTDNAGISWYRLIEPLSRDREIWAVDLPGFGGSIGVAPVGGPRALATVLADVLDRIDPGPMVVAGVSMGGDVALNLVLEHPDRVAALVLIAPGGLVPIFRNRVVHFCAWLAAQMPDRLLIPAGRFANRFVRSAIRSIVKDPSSLPPQVIDEFVRAARDPRSPYGYCRYNQATLGRRGMLNDLSGRVTAITAPTLIFHGEDDGLVDPRGSQRAAARMPNARLVMVPDCGHWAQLEAHDRFLTEIRAFLAGLDVPGEPERMS